MRIIKYEKDDLETIVKKRDNTIKARDNRIITLEDAVKD
jgi:hypothetical protein|tara:strand:- start:515 stop:631 length:117 start_codon:yes stop_codon:yes gene_type:complete